MKIKKVGTSNKLVCIHDCAPGSKKKASMGWQSDYENAVRRLRSLAQTVELGEWDTLVVVANGVHVALLESQQSGRQIFVRWSVQCVGHSLSHSQWRTWQTLTAALCAAFGEPSESYATEESGATVLSAVWHVSKSPISETDGTPTSTP